MVHVSRSTEQWTERVLASRLLCTSSARMLWSEGTTTADLTREAVRRARRAMGARPGEEGAMAGCSGSSVGPSQCRLSSSEV